MTEFEIIVDQVKRRRDEFIARLQRRVSPPVPNPELGTPCRFWLGQVTPNGYGRISFRLPGREHTNLYVHRLFLILRLCRPLAADREAGHLCHNRLCVVHLEEQTRNDNMKECNGRRWGKKAAKR